MTTALEREPAPTAEPSVQLQPPRPPSWYACDRGVEYCGSCGRQLVTTREPGRFDHATGEREVEVWHSCPRYLCHQWQAALLPGYGAGHDSHSADNRILARTWR